MYKDLDGAAKFEAAQKEIVEQLNEKGIKITDLELKVMIEAAVNGLKEGMSQPVAVLETTTEPIKEISTTDE